MLLMDELKQQRSKRFKAARRMEPESKLAIQQFGDLQEQLFDRTYATCLNVSNSLFRDSKLKNGLFVATTSQMRLSASNRASLLP
mmetsp:Transcript_64494/g.75667  ORF Transcript_64494/g.75667 Transcript_64494/m.75667 type:complete len:85 (-) Transcript_64494:181-435(-)